MSNPYESPDWLGGFRPGGVALTGRLLERAGLPPGSVLLDVGCGEGESCDFLLRSGYRAGGFDCSADLIARGRARFPHCDLVVGDAAAPPFPPDSRDALLMECVLSAVDAPRVLAGCLPLLRPGGALLVSDVYARGKPDHGEKPVLYTREQLEELLLSSGLQVLAFADVSDTLTEFLVQKLFDGAQLEQLLCTSMERFRRARAGYCLLWAGRTRTPGETERGNDSHENG